MRSEQQQLKKVIYRDYKTLWMPVHYTAICIVLNINITVSFTHKELFGSAHWTNCDSFLKANERQNTHTGETEELALPYHQNLFILFRLYINCFLIFFLSLSLSVRDAFSVRSSFVCNESVSMLVFVCVCFFGHLPNSEWECL